MIESIIRNFPLTDLPPNLSCNKNEIANRVNEISVLWKKFDDIFERLKSDYPNVSDEELIRMIYTVIDFFSGLPAFEKILDKKLLESIKVAFSGLLIEQIRAITEEFRQHQITEGYKDIKRLFPYFGDRLNSILIDNSVDSFDFFTTNYDGILDTLLTKGTEKGFLSTDGFGKDPDSASHLRLIPDSLYDYRIKCIHIHGSYRFEKKYGNTFKTRTIKQQNLEPVIIFNNPLQKESLIRRDPVLSHYYSYMANSLKQVDTLVVFGNSMVNEPHLQSLISEKYDSAKKLFICSRNPSKIANNIRRTYSGNIIELSTTSIKTIFDLISFIENLVK